MCLLADDYVVDSAFVSRTHRSGAPTSFSLCCFLFYPLILCLPPLFAPLLGQHGLESIFGAGLARGAQNSVDPLSSNQLTGPTADLAGVRRPALPQILTFLSGRCFRAKRMLRCGLHSTSVMGLSSPSTALSAHDTTLTWRAQKQQESVSHP